MNLTFSNTNLADLGSLRIIGRVSRREPALAPTRERVEYQVRLDFFEQTFAANYNLIQQLAAAMKANVASLQWQDDNGTQYEAMTVTAGDFSTEAAPLERGGTYWQAITFSFWYYQALAAGTLTGSFTAAVAQGLPAQPAQDLGSVELWSEKLTSERFDPLHSERRMVIGTVNCAGKWIGDATQSLGNMQPALLAKKDALILALAAQSQGVLAFGTFSQTVRVTEFAAEVNQVRNWIAWTATFTFTRYPDEANYSILELRAQTRENQAEGIEYITLSGRIRAATEASAEASLAAFVASIVPATFSLVSQETTPTTVGSDSDASGDGTFFSELSFTWEYRDVSTLKGTFQRSAPNAPVVSLGTVDKFGERKVTTLFDPMRSVRNRAAGQVTMSGKWFAPESLTVAQKQTLLLAQEAAMKTEIVKGCNGPLIYGAAFNQVVRVLDFDAQVNRLTNQIEWSLSASWTDYPNESDYALADIQVGTREDQTQGTVFITLTGRIAAQSPEAAYSKLARLRNAFVPAGYVLTGNDPQERHVSSESNFMTTGQNQGDGDAFIEVTINESWQKTVDGNVLEWTLRIATEVDTKSPVVRTIYSGTVRAAAATQAAALAAANVQASVLGAGQGPMLMRSSVVEDERLFQTTDGQIFVAVNFSYEYASQNTVLYLEVRSELATDNYGNNTRVVTGFVVASSLATASATYQTNVRALFGGQLVLSERLPTLNQMQLQQPDQTFATLDERYDFNLVILLPKATGKTSIRYDLQTTPDFRTLELTSTLQGTVWASSQTEGEALIQSTLVGLALAGKLIANPRTPHFRAGPATTGGAPVQVFESMDFTVTLVGLFTGLSGILISECAEEFLFSGNRNIEKPIPDGVSILQQCGITLGVHTITARCVATTAAAANAWVRTIRAALMQSLNGNASALEDPPRISQRYAFLPQIAGVPTGTNANVTVVEVSATFSEKIPQLVFS